MIIVIAGPTGSGKTSLSEVLAKEMNALIINADSRQVYKELNIGTAKLKPNEITKNHFLFDIKNPDEEYNAYDYQKDVRNIISQNQNKNIIIVGGTGLYIKAALYDYDFSSNNKDKLLYNAVFIGLNADRENLYKRINQRVDEMFEEGLLEEASVLYKKYGDIKILKNTIGYQELIEYFNGHKSLEEAKEQIKINSRHYAKRQYTWFKNQMNMIWVDVDFENFNKTIKSVQKILLEKSQV